MTINGICHSWDKYRHRGIVELDDRRTLQVHARDLAAAQRRPAWKGPFELRSGDRAEFVCDAGGRVVDVLRVW
ncbi:hypothetical protein [Bradyrhizobium pachyrhizi]|uniref:hypothetical protein n=1 Tax=Bradyrhizobium pachyrhizi TaxID=280333 RepID=UPI003D36D1EE